MRKMLALIVVLFATANICVAKEPSFQGLGDLPGGINRSMALDVSADGSVVVGFSFSESNQEAFRWENGTMVGLGELEGGGSYSVARAVSDDGTTIVGESLSASGTEAFRWKSGVMEGIGYTSGGTLAIDSSDDGSVVVGIGNGGFRWTLSGGMDYLGFGDVWGVSADGSVIVGLNYSGITYSGHEAFRWENGVLEGLGDLNGGIMYSAANAVSSDGSVVVGRSCSASGIEAFIWYDGVMKGLGDLVEENFKSEAWGGSGDGTVVVGTSGSIPNRRAFIWDSDNEMRDLKDVLEIDHGLDLSDWSLYEARGISDDGLAIVGYGTNPEGHIEAWIATIPEPCTLSLLALGGLMVRKRRL